MADRRPTPRRAPRPTPCSTRPARETRGRLKIFLGAAPGVGKTYEMLTAGAAPQRATASTSWSAWSRPTAAPRPRRCSTGFEVVPRAQRRLSAAARSRRWTSTRSSRAGPQLVLVDELAHTNAPGSRHPKRYQDVEELLAAGIDVYTTLNIQHLESLNDVVAQITRVRVRETVPDSRPRPRRRDRAGRPHARRADRSGCKDGKVYVPETGDARARALLLARQPDGAARAGAAPHRRSGSTRSCSATCRRMPSPAPGRPASACSSASSERPARAGAGALRQAARRPAARALDRASRRDAAQRRARPRPTRDRIADTLRLAERLGGEAVTLPGGGAIADDIARLRAREQRHADRHRQVDALALVRAAARLGRPRPRPPRRRHQRPRHRRRRAAEPTPPKPAATAPRRAALDWPALCRGAAGRRARRSASAMLLEPLRRRRDARPRLPDGGARRRGRASASGRRSSPVVAGVARLQLLLPAAALHASPSPSPTNVAALRLLPRRRGRRLATSPRASARRPIAARSRARTTEALYGFSRKLAGIGTLDDVLWATAYQIASHAEGAGRAAAARGRRARGAGRLSARGHARRRRPRRRATGPSRTTGPPAAAPTRCPAPSGLFLPHAHRPRRRSASSASTPTGTGPLLTPEQRRLLDALADQAALAIERVQLVADVDRAERAAETDRLRPALLTSISHDLRTPLAADPRRGRHAARLRRRPDRGEPRRAARRRSSTNPSG